MYNKYMHYLYLVLGIFCFYFLFLNYVQTLFALKFINKKIGLQINTYILMSIYWFLIIAGFWFATVLTKNTQAAETKCQVTQAFFRPSGEQDSDWF